MEVTDAQGYELKILCTSIQKHSTGTYKEGEFFLSYLLLNCIVGVRFSIHHSKISGKNYVDPRNLSSLMKRKVDSYDQSAKQCYCFNAIVLIFPHV